MVKTNVGGGTSVAIFPRVNSDDVGGWFLEAGRPVFFLPHPKLAKALDAGLDVFFDFSSSDPSALQTKMGLTSPKFFLGHFQEFTVG